MDPARDDPEALMSVASKRKLDGARWSLASPAPDNVRGVAGVLGVRYRQLADGEFNHTSALVLLDREGRIVPRPEQIGSQVDPEFVRSEEHTSELQSLMRISYAVFSLTKKNTNIRKNKDK